LFGGVVPRFVLLGLGENSEKGGVGVGDPASECETANKYRETREDAVEEIECANGTDTDKEEHRSLHPEK
jgi:hypothetical protein